MSGDKLTAAEIKKQALSKMLESLIAGKSDEAAEQLHDYLQVKTREIIAGDDEQLEEFTKDQAFANAHSVMSDKSEKVNFKHGGKKTVLRPDGNKDDPNLDMDKTGKVKFKGSAKTTMPRPEGNKEAKGLESGATVAKYDDGRDFDLGTLDEGLLDEIYEIVMEAKPSAGLSKKEKSEVVKKARAGKDIGKKGKNWDKVVAAAKKHGAKDPEAVAGAAMWKNIKR